MRSLKATIVQLSLCVCVGSNRSKIEHSRSFPEEWSPLGLQIFLSYACFALKMSSFYWANLDSKNKTGNYSIFKHANLARLTVTAKKPISSMANSIADCATMQLICLRFVNYNHRPNC